MSLRPDDRKSRSRSKSPAGRRERSRSNVRAPSPGPQYYASAAGHGGADATPQYHVGQAYQSSPDEEEPITMGNYTDLPPHERPGYMQQAQAAQQYQHSTGDRGPISPSIYSNQPVQYSQTPYNYQTTPATHAGITRNPAGTAAAAFQYAPPPDKITFTAKPIVPTTQQPAVRHTPTPTSGYPQPQHPHPPYTAMPQAPPPPIGAGPPSFAQQQAYPPPPPIQDPRDSRESLKDSKKSKSGHSRSKSHSVSTYKDHNVVEMVPGGGGKLNAPPSPRPHSLSVSGNRPSGLTSGMNRLSVSGNRPDLQEIVPGGYPGGGGGGLPPPSPMLEAYHGVYQSISPMPGPMMMPDDDLDYLAPLDGPSPRASSSSIHAGRRRGNSSSGRSPSPSRRKPKDKLAMEAYGDGRDHGRDHGRDSGRDRVKEKRVKIYDASEDALDLVEAMSARPPNPDPIIDILTALTHDQMLELRNEYKKHCKVQGKGINIAKHIKLKVSGNFGNIAYVTALGKYESEGHWANYWYQSGNSKRELLIEALMGRQNYEIREIKDAFRDKRYGDSLTKCMDKELKADKFRKAVLMALEGERQEESDVWPTEYRNRDVDTLYKAMHAREGGESLMLSIVIMRSDAHLREVLRTYERKYGQNFAREALKKSNNLVGEVIAHILNGVINRPSRDAMLLHHAVMDLIDPGKSSSRESSSKHQRQQRYELLTSRLVRLHWDRLHLMRVKTEYEEKYGRLIEEDLEEATKGDFREFCIALCQTDR